MKRSLEMQILENVRKSVICQQRKKIKSRLEEKEHVRTNFGPEEDEDTYKKHTSKRNYEREQMRNNLLSQIKEKQEH